MRRWTQIVVVLVGMALVAPACTPKKQSPPALSGPSELALSVSVQAIPDVIRQDGASQSRIAVLARDANAQPVRNLSLRADIVVGGILVDFGQLSAKNIVTGSDGTTQVVYTAPNAPPDPSYQGGVIEIVISPVGTDYANSAGRTVSIRLVPPGVILPPGQAPTASFVFSPSLPSVGSTVTFDGSSSTSSTSAIAGYLWNFGDGVTATGVVATHAFQSSGDYTVTLTVTDIQGLSASTTKTVTVATSAPPSAAFDFSPTQPQISQDIFFNASKSTAAAGRQIVSYDWDFGTGRTGTGLTISKSYDTPGAYTVTLVVTDDIGNKGATSKTVTVASTLVANFTVTPASPTAGVPAVFDGSTSTGPSGVASWTWDFGDGSPVVGPNSLPLQNHPFPVVGPSGTLTTYFVVLTVKDAVGQVATKSLAVVVRTP